MPQPWIYNLIYRFGAPWEGGPRPELVALVESGRLSLERLSPGRAVDLGCGSGANTLYLAERGFEAVGVDFSKTALRKARRAASERELGGRVRFLRGDLTANEIPGAEGPFDLLIDYGTLDDLKDEARRAMAATVVRLSRPGSMFLLWCFYARASDLPLISFSGASKLAPAIAPGEERELFGEAFDIERLLEPPDGSRAACFLMVRRSTSRVVLRDVVEDDLPILFEHQRDPEANRMAGFPARDREAFMAHWNKILADESVVTKTVLVDGRVAGNIVSFEWSGKREVGYWIGRDHWGKGVATKALTQFLEQVSTRPLYAGVTKHNVASLRVLEKCGFTISGGDRWAPEPSGEHVDEWILKLDA